MEPLIIHSIKLTIWAFGLQKQNIIMSIMLPHVPFIAELLQV